MTGEIINSNNSTIIMPAVFAFLTMFSICTNSTCFQNGIVNYTLIMSPVEYMSPTFYNDQVRIEPMT